MGGRGVDFTERMRKAAAEYAANSLTLNFGSGGNEALEDIMRRRTQREVIPSTPTDRDLARAATSINTLLTEAERMARQQGEAVISGKAINMAFIKLCPGLYPIC